MRLTMNVDAEGLLRQLGILAPTIRRKVLRKAATKAGQAATKEAKARCPIRDTEAQRVSAKQRGGRGRASYVFTGDFGFDAPKTKTYRGGLLRKSLGYKVKYYSNSGTCIAIMGPRAGFSKQVGVVTEGKYAGQAIIADPVNYAHLVVKGTKHSEPQDFMTPAQDVAKKVMFDALWFGVDQALAEVAKS